MFVDPLRRAVRRIPLFHTVLVNLVPQARVRAMAGFRSYCQNLSRMLAEPVFVKIGANDGLAGDPISDILVANTNWRGLLIEPVPHCFERLRANFSDARRFRLEQVAIGATAGKASFYYVDPRANQHLPDVPPWFDRIGSFDRNHIVKHWKGRLEPFILECQVPVSTLSEVLARNRIQDVHLLQVDTEGHDYEVLKTVDFVKHAPLSIFVEHRHLPRLEKGEMRHILHKHGYSIRDCGADYFAINEEANRRLQRKARHS